MAQAKPDSDSVSHGNAVKNLKVNPPLKGSKALKSAPKEGSTSDSTSCISSGDASGSIKEIEVDQEAVTTDQSVCYYGYYHPGFSGSFGEWDDQYYVLGSDEIQHSAAQTDNGSVLYYMPGFQHGYSPYPPGTVVGVDGQYFTQQPYYSSLMFQQPPYSPGYYPQSVAYGNTMFPMYQWEFPTSYSDGPKGNVLDESPTPRSHKLTSSRNFLPRMSTATEKKDSLPVSDDKPENKVTTTASKSHVHTSKLPPYSSQVKSGLLYQNQSTVKEVGPGSIGAEKLKTKNKANGVGSFSLLNEQNKGPRTDSNKIIFTSSSDQGESLASEGDERIMTLVKEKYNLPDFPTKYNHALFFVIKSYSEDDIHKCIKYNVWSSTPNGNKRLNNAFQLAQQRMAETEIKCPVFLFFSVNASGQFCGVAEMIGPVDFNKKLDFWQQDKWAGYFAVKWHIIKDIPNPQFRHIILENNENKPVTNSRDTQEVKFPQGTEILNIFKNYSSNTSILDDFGFYENRQKAVQAKKLKSCSLKMGYIGPRADEVSEEREQIDLKSTAAIHESYESTMAKAEKLLDAVSLTG